CWATSPSSMPARPSSGPTASREAAAIPTSGAATAAAGPASARTSTAAEGKGRPNGAAFLMLRCEMTRGDESFDAGPISIEQSRAEQPGSFEPGPARPQPTAGNTGGGTQ